MFTFIVFKSRGVARFIFHTAQNTVTIRKQTRNTNNTGQTFWNSQSRLSKQTTHEKHNKNANKTTQTHSQTQTNRKHKTTTKPRTNTQTKQTNNNKQTTKNKTQNTKTDRADRLVLFLAIAKYNENETRDCTHPMLLCIHLWCLCLVGFCGRECVCL